MASMVLRCEAPSPPGEKATVGAHALSTSPANTDTTVTAPEQKVTTCQRFGPGLGKAIFSTELCTRAPRSLGSYRPPVLVRSVIPRSPEYHAAVVEAAHHWQRKHKAQCLCIFPGQGWIIEDLWDAEDIHIEGKAFCEEMLTFIERDTYYAAKKFADDWMRAHPDRLTFLGGDMGNINNPSDPLVIVDNIFIFQEAEDFPRGFLWHVAHMMRTTVMENSQMNTSTSDANQAQHFRVEHHGSNKAGKSEESRTSSTHATVSKSSSVAETSARLATMPPAAPYQPNIRSTSQQGVPPHSLPQPGGYHTHPKGYNMGTMVAQPMASPSVHPQAMNLPRGTRNMGSGSYNQPPMAHGWATENTNRVPSGPHPRQHPGSLSNMHSPQFAPAAVAMNGQSMMIPAFPSNAVTPYSQAPPMGPAPGYQAQYLDPSMATHGHMIYQPGPMQVSPGGQVYMPQPPHGPPMDDMPNNVYYPSNIATPYTETRASAGRRPGNALFDPYNGTNRKFSDTTGYHGGGKKAGSNAFPTQLGGSRDRRTSTSNGRPTYNNPTPNANHPITTSFNRSQHSGRRPQIEDDPVITGDSFGGCHMNWIGSGNSTVKELYIGYLPMDVEQDEIKDLFEDKVGIVPKRVVIGSSVGKGNYYHAFVEFTSSEEAKAALRINELSPCLRSKDKVSVSVPRRYYQKDPSPSSQRVPSTPGYFNQTHIGQVDDRAARGVARTSSHHESAVTDTDAAPATSVKAQYSPQDARSDLRKKVAQSTESNDPLRTGSPKAQKSKRQQTSPTKDATSKQPVDKPSLPKEDTQSTRELSKKDAPKFDPQSAAKVSMPDSTTASSVSSAQDKTITEILPLETETFAVDNETHMPEIVPAVEDSIDQLKDADFKYPGVAPVTPSPQSPDDTVSDDEAKNDSSFVSAKEEVEPQLEVQDGSATANQDTAATTVPSTEVSPHVEANPSSPAPAEEMKEDVSQVTSIQPAKQEAVLSNAQSILQGATENPKDHEVSQVSGQAADTRDKVAVPTEDTTTVSVSSGVSLSTPMQSSLVGVAKRTGAHQVESLSPFAKAGKLTKKEKEKQKQLRKKEEAGRAKAKAEKHTLSIKSSKGTVAQTKLEQATDSGDLPTTTDSSAQPTAATVLTNTQKFKGNTKADTKEQEKTLSGGGEVSGKPNSGTTTKVSPEIASVTQKASIAETTKANQEFSTASGTPFTGPPTVTASDDLTPPSPLPALPKKAQALSNKKTDPAVNHLNPSTHGSPTHKHNQGSKLDSSPSSTANLPQPDMSPSTRPPHHSNASSATFQPDNVITSTHASTASTDFPTNATVTDAPQTEGPKKKKNKNKKKNKKKTLAPTAEESTPGDGKGNAVPSNVSSLSDGKEHRYDYAAFEDQLSHIEAIRRANASGAYEEAFKPKSEQVPDENGIDDFIKYIFGPQREKYNGKTGLIPDEHSAEALREQLAAYCRENPEKRFGAKAKPTAEPDLKKSQD